MSITGVNNTPNQPNRVTERGGVTRNSDVKSKEVQSTSSSTNSDSIEISAGAKEAGTVQRLTQSAQTSPDIRVDVVAAAKEKLANGEYEGVEISRQTAEKLAKSLFDLD